MLPTTWSWDMGSTSSSVNDYCPYPDEISKEIEICYLTMGPERFECDVGGGRVVTKTRKGLVQHIKGKLTVFTPLINCVRQRNETGQPGGELPSLLSG